MGGKKKKNNRVSGCFQVCLISAEIWQAICAPRRVYLFRWDLNLRATHGERSYVGKDSSKTPSLVEFGRVCVCVCVCLVGGGYLDLGVLVVRVFFFFFLGFVFKLRNITIEGSPGGPYSKESACNAWDRSSIPGPERSPVGGHGNPLQYSCLQNPHGQRNYIAGPSCSPILKG